MHFHAIQGLGVEMVEVVQQLGVPTVVTAHDAWWFCERQFMVRPSGVWCGQVGIDAGVCAGCIPDPVAHRRRQEQSRRILNTSGRVLAPSDYWLTVLRGSGVSHDVLRVNRNGVFAPAPGFLRTPYTGPVRFGYVGGDNRSKGAPQIRRALADLPRSDYRLRLVDAAINLGSRSLFQPDWQVPGLVEIVPGYTHGELDSFFDSIDVLLFPSQWRESYGLTVREAILRGVWVIATEGGGVSEDLVDGVNATLIPMDGSHQHLQDAIRAVLDDPAAFRNRAHEIRPIPTFDDQVREVEGIYRDLVAVTPG